MSKAFGNQGYVDTSTLHDGSIGVTGDISSQVGKAHFFRDACQVDVRLGDDLVDPVHPLLLSLVNMAIENRKHIISRIRILFAVTSQNLLAVHVDGECDLPMRLLANIADVSVLNGRISQIGYVREVDASAVIAESGLSAGRSRSRILAISSLLMARFFVLVLKWLILYSRNG